MKHFYKEIPGWFTYPKFYSDMVYKFDSNSKFVEIGAFKGTSSCYMAVEIANSGKAISFDVIDTWDTYKEEPLYPIYLQNIQPVKHIINPIRTTSLEGSKLYEDSSLDFVFIDAAHDYESVKADIAAWYPKVKAGAVLGGHDYHASWPGVIQAVNEFISENNYTLFKKNELCWGIVKK